MTQSTTHAPVIQAPGSKITSQSLPDKAPPPDAPAAAATARPARAREYSRGTGCPDWCSHLNDSLHGVVDGSYVRHVESAHVIDDRERELMLWVQVGRYDWVFEPEINNVDEIATVRVHVGDDAPDPYDQCARELTASQARAWAASLLAAADRADAINGTARLELASERTTTALHEAWCTGHERLVDDHRRGQDVTEVCGLTLLARPLVRVEASQATFYDGRTERSPAEVVLDDEALPTAEAARLGAALTAAAALARRTPA